MTMRLSSTSALIVASTVGDTVFPVAASRIKNCLPLHIRTISADFPKKRLKLILLGHNSLSWFLYPMTDWLTDKTMLHYIAGKSDKQWPAHLTSCCICGSVYCCRIVSSTAADDSRSRFCNCHELFLRRSVSTNFECISDCAAYIQWNMTQQFLRLPISTKNKNFA